MKDLIQKFKYNAESTTATVEITDKVDIAKAIIAQIKTEENVLVSLNDKSILNLLPSNINLIQAPTKEEIKSIKVCITDSEAGIASTGSVLIDNDKGYSSFMTMLSRKHIVILDTKKIHTNPRDIFGDKNLSAKSSFSIITGPSATADMGSLVRGVHGPEQLHIILYVENEN